MFRATGSVPKFDGFLAVYEEGKDQKDEDDEELKHRLPAVTQGEVLKFKAIEPEQHFTEPPPRFNEATLVKELEANGVGRPSTYASILSTIQEREYVKKEGGRFTPTELGDGGDRPAARELRRHLRREVHGADGRGAGRDRRRQDRLARGDGASSTSGSRRISKHAEAHMTDIKRMEKPTDLICDKCGKPLVIKWGKHGSFIACTGYPEFSPRAMEADFQALQKEAAKRQERASAEREKRLGKLRAKYPGHAIDWSEEGGWRLFPIDMEVRNVPKELSKIDAVLKERREKDREQLDGRIQKMIARQKQIPEFYELGVQDSAAGPTVVWQAKPNLCTYTRELTVDLPDIDKADLSEQGEEEYCENCGRPMVLKKGRFGTVLRLLRISRLQDDEADRRTAEEGGLPLDEKCPSCGSEDGAEERTLRRVHGVFSNYPTCKYVKQKTIGVKCPECSEGEVVERRSRSGKTFYGCNRYPDCKFVAWGKPVQEKCPECGNSYMIEKWLKAGPVWQCPNEECKHKQAAPQEAPQPVEA